MIDLHSHILPRLDDGSKSVDESLKMLKMLSAQEVTKVAATPHFYANHNSVDEFLNRRQISYEKLIEKYSPDLPQILLGAEVKYYEGISRLENLNSLCIGNTKLLLLEMSAIKWTEYSVRELLELATRGDIYVVLAHIERYMRFQSKDMIPKLVESGILIQANADFFLSIATRRKAISMLMSNLIHFVGSDCHDLESRPPNIGYAANFIKRKTGERFFDEMKQYASSFFN